MPWSEVSRLIEARIGLHFAAPQWPDLERGLAAAAARLGLPDAPACVQRLLTGRLGEPGWQVLAECLTVGETYFFRDAQTFDELAARVLVPLIAARKRQTRHLRLWSAACSTGEEAWSLAMLVANLLPDWRDWNVSILATDISASALRKAQAGRYGSWSMRSAVPAQARGWLHPGADGRFEVDPGLRSLVRFAHLNLAGADYPSAASMTLSMDVVLCRNVLIYFEAARARAVLARLGSALAPGGWLVTAPVELPRQGIAGLEVVSTGPLAALRASNAIPDAPVDSWPAAACAVPIQSAATSEDGRTCGLPDPGQPPAVPPEALMGEARDHADCGDLQHAEQLCRQAIERDKLDPEATHLLASILHERGAIGESIAALQRTLYLDPGHVLARFALGTLALRHGEPHAGRHHLAHARARLARCAPDTLLPGAGGLTAGELEHVIRHAEAQA